MALCIIAEYSRSNDRPTTDETPINMFIHLSTKEKIIDRNIVKRLNCPECGHVQHSIFAVVKTFRIFWIPFFGVFKKYITCLSCEKTMAVKDIPLREMRDQANVFPIKLTDYLKAFLLEVIVICVVATPFIGHFFVYSGLNSEHAKISREKYNTAHYAFRKKCDEIKQGDYFIVDLRLFDKTKYQNSIYKVIRIDQNAGDASASSYKLLVSKQEFKSTDDAKTSLQERQNESPDYFLDENLQTVQGENLINLCERSFMRVVVAPAKIDTAPSPQP